MLFRCRHLGLNLHLKQCIQLIKPYSTVTGLNSKQGKTMDLLKKKYEVDDWTNIPPKIFSHLGKNLHTQKYHPLSLIRQRIVNYFYKNYKNRADNPIFSVYDNISPIVTTEQNFDSLLVPKDHPSRNKTDVYYVNQDIVLRSHTSAHQSELIKMGLDNFLIVGEVFRRDEIDSKHYPVFHQLEAVRICNSDEVFKNVANSQNLQLFENKGLESQEKQACHSLEAVKIMEHELKSSLLGVAQDLYGKDIKYRWSDEYFPFTHPSWELEVFHNDNWMEVCGCGIMRQEILQKAGISDRIGWAFGLGLERLAMHLYNIPDIRCFWSTDTGFLNQFKVDDIYTPIQFKPVSTRPQCTNDMSFWIPDDGSYSSNDFYDLVREIGNDTIEQIHLIDVFTHPETKKTSHCYRIVYRHMERVLTQQEVTQIHNRIKLKAKNTLNVIPR